MGGKTVAKNAAKKTVRFFMRGASKGQVSLLSSKHFLRDGALLRAAGVSGSQVRAPVVSGIVREPLRGEMASHHFLLDFTQEIEVVCLIRMASFGTIRKAGHVTRGTTPVDQQGGAAVAEGMTNHAAQRANAGIPIEAVGVEMQLFRVGRGIEELVKFGFRLAFVTKHSLHSLQLRFG